MIICVVLSLELIVILLFTDDGQATVTCTIISTSPITVTAAGGAIIDGTENVIIYCLCIRNNVAVGGTAKWFLNSTQITDTTDSGSPYFKNVVPSQLIIPSFTSTTAGRYSCGHTITFADASSHIDLTLSM